MKLTSAKYSEPTLSVGLLILRVVTGSAMIINHGMKKVTGFSEILEKGFADPFGMGPKTSLALAIFAEVFCAALLIAGLLTRVASFFLIITMAVALFFIHGGNMFAQGEMAAIFLAIFLTLLCAGPGRFSLDKLISKK